jgi:hypothetical protein
MESKNNNTLLIVVGIAAVVGYLYYKKGLGTPTTQIVNAPSPLQGLAQAANPAGIAIEQPSPADVNVYTPSLDPTGQSLQLF